MEYYPQPDEQNWLPPNPINFPGGLLLVLARTTSSSNKTQCLLVLRDPPKFYPRPCHTTRRSTSLLLLLSVMAGAQPGFGSCWMVA